MTSLLLAPITSNGNLAWKIYLEVKDFIESLGKGDSPIDASKKSKWNNTNDSNRCLIEIPIFIELQFHFQGIDTLVEVWKMLNIVFSIKNEL